MDIATHAMSTVSINMQYTEMETPQSLNTYSSTIVIFKYFTSLSMHAYTFLLTPATGLGVAGLKNVSILCCVAPCLLFKIFFTPFLTLSSLQIYR